MEKGEEVSLKKSLPIVQSRYNQGGHRKEGQKIRLIMRQPSSREGGLKVKPKKEGRYFRKTVSGDFTGNC